MTFKEIKTDNFYLVEQTLYYNFSKYYVLTDMKLEIFFVEYH